MADALLHVVHATIVRDRAAQIVRRFGPAAKAGFEKTGIAFTAAKMIVAEPLLDPVFDAGSWGQWATWGTYVVAILGVWLAGRCTLQRVQQVQTRAES